MNKVKLDIDINCDILTECWTLNRLVIISTFPKYMEWLIDKFNTVTYNGDGFFDFGYETMYDPLKFYKDMLIQEEVMDKSVDNIINFIKDEINKGNYLIINMDYSKIFDKHPFHIHDQLIFGYDDFTSTVDTLVVSDGNIEIQTFTYDSVKNSFEYTKGRDDFRVFDDAFNYPITRLITNKNNNPKNIVERFKISINESLNSKELQHGRVVGSGIYEELNKMILNDLTSEGFEHFKRLTLFIKKIYESKILLRKKAMWLNQEFNIKLDIEDSINKISSLLKSNYLSILLYKEKRDKKIIDNLIKNFNIVRDLESDIYRNILKSEDMIEKDRI